MRGPAPAHRRSPRRGRAPRRRSSPLAAGQAGRARPAARPASRFAVGVATTDPVRAMPVPISTSHRYPGKAATLFRPGRRRVLTGACFTWNEAPPGASSHVPRETMRTTPRDNLDIYQRQMLDLALDAEKDEPVTDPEELRTRAASLFERLRKGGAQAKTSDSPAESDLSVETTGADSPPGVTGGPPSADESAPPVGAMGRGSSVGVTPESPALAVATDPRRQRRHRDRDRRHRQPRHRTGGARPARSPARQPTSPEPTGLPLNSVERRTAAEPSRRQPVSN